jgi:hypothetical protein
MQRLEFDNQVNQMRKDQTAALRKQNQGLESHVKTLSAENKALTEKFLGVKNLMISYEHERILIGLKREHYLDALV